MLYRFSDWVNIFLCHPSLHPLKLQRVMYNEHYITLHIQIYIEALNRQAKISFLCVLCIHKKKVSQIQCKYVHYEKSIRIHSTRTVHTDLNVSIRNELASLTLIGLMSPWGAISTIEDEYPSHDGFRLSPSETHFKLRMHYSLSRRFQ